MTEKAQAEMLLKQVKDDLFHRVLDIQGMVKKYTGSAAYFATSSNVQETQIWIAGALCYFVFFRFKKFSMPGENEVCEQVLSCVLNDAKLRIAAMDDDQMVDVVRELIYNPEYKKAVNQAVQNTPEWFEFPPLEHSRR